MPPAFFVNVQFFPIFVVQCEKWKIFELIFNAAFSLSARTRNIALMAVLCCAALALWPKWIIGCCSWLVHSFVPLFVYWQHSFIAVSIVFAGIVFHIVAGFGCCCRRYWVANIVQVLFGSHSFGN